MAIIQILLVIGACIVLIGLIAILAIGLAIGIYTGWKALKNEINKDKR